MDETERLSNAAPDVEDVDIYGEDGAVRSSYLARVGAAIADRDVLFLRSHVGKLHQSELGHVLEALQSEQRRALVELLGDEFDFASLTEVDEAVRLEIVDAMPNRQIAEAVQDLDSDDAVYILEDLDQEDRDEILGAIAIYRAGAPPAFTGLSGRDGWPPHADRVCGCAAVLDGGADHRLYARE